MNPALHWQKSSFSEGGDGNTCVELAAIEAELIHLRESDTPATRLTTTPTPLTQLILGIKSGRLSSPPA
ncbi:DUF397 domain-containing protein [Streptomyces jeddahensis]|uniref:DUF397 domain-containing protein n=1 Tax=Streptomyces jeddahensis TaxID=1716141 RepID=A0A177HGK4_9ACTN|nr:DUF397 domain-containing protein [Streptomyces jeddahensis]OAH09298.1 hypothetical protein STSP_73820 [Streptomyces jeddahensis]